jgi:chemotaxis protein CheD
MPAPFEHQRTGLKRHVIQGEHAVSDEPEALLTTVLGSCVAACLHDPGRGVGGMNHFLLAQTSEGVRVAEEAMRYGAYAMEVLINDLMKRGARRERLEAKLFGGAKMVDGLSDIGSANAAFARRFLEDEGIPIISASLGGRRARRVEFWPSTGRARQREVEDLVSARAPREPAPIYGNDVELF